MSHVVDVLIVGGEVCDGSGADRRCTSIGITGDQISYVGDEAVEARRVIDATGLVVAPGFVDMHVHADLACLLDPRRESQLRQGVTTEVIGQDGLGYAPMSRERSALVVDAMTAWNGLLPSHYESFTVDQYLDEIDRLSSLNIAYLMPHGSIRMHVMGLENRSATESELAEMSRILRHGLSIGAFGMSSGLTYVPGLYATNEELIRLNRVVAEFDGIYVPHHRNYGRGALDAYQECIDVAQESGVRLHLTHAHLGFAANRGKAPALLNMLEDASATGVGISLDAYPYGPAATALAALLPRWVLELPRVEQVACLSSDEVLIAIASELESVGSDGHMGEPIDWDRIIVSSVRDPELSGISGKSIAQVARERSCSPIHAVAYLLLNDSFYTGVIVDVGNQENVDAIVTSRFHSGGSDGMFVGDKPHPRGFGSHARLIADYVRIRSLVRLEDMVRQLSAFPASVLGLTDRGLLREGFRADICVFDADRLEDQATFDNPKRLAVGMHSVLINGEFALDEGERTDSIPGRALRHRNAVVVSCR